MRLVGQFGFDPLAQPERQSARIAIPRQTNWTLEAAPHRSAIAGRTLDAIATSAAAPCLSSAELQIGSENDDTHEDTPSRLNVMLRPAQALGDRAYGALQLQLVDTQPKAASDWISVPGAFVRAPLVERIKCPPGPSVACTLIGSGLAAIAGVEDTSGHVAPPGYVCTSDVKGLACVTVPRLKHYRLRLQDAPLTIDVPDSKIGAPTPGPTPSAAPKSSITTFEGAARYAPSEETSI